MRLIDADALIKKFEKFKEDSTRLTDMLFLDGAMAAVDNMPTITIEKEVPKNVIKTETISQACPVCKHQVNWKYCSNCGQKLNYSERQE